MQRKKNPQPKPHTLHKNSKMDHTFKCQTIKYSEEKKNTRENLSDAGRAKIQGWMLDITKKKNIKEKNRKFGVIKTKILRERKDQP